MNESTFNSMPLIYGRSLCDLTLCALMQIESKMQIYIDKEMHTSDGAADVDFFHY